MKKNSYHRKHRKNLTMSQIPFKCQQPQDELPQLPVLSQQMSDYASRQLQYQEKQEELEREENQQNSQVKDKKKMIIVLCMFFIITITTEIVVVCKEDWYNSNDIPECEVLRKWTIGSIAGKFVFNINTFQIWRKKRKINLKNQHEQVELSKKIHCFNWLISMICASGIMGQLIYIQYECNVLQISVIITASIMFTIIFVMLIKFCLKYML